MCDSKILRPVLNKYMTGFVHYFKVMWNIFILDENLMLIFKKFVIKPTIYVAAIQQLCTHCKSYLE